MTMTDDGLEAPRGGGFTFWGLLIVVALIAALAVVNGCATTPDPKPATGPLLDPVWHTEVLNVTVDNE